MGATVSAIGSGAASTPLRRVCRSAGGSRACARRTIARRWQRSAAPAVAPAAPPATPPESAAAGRPRPATTDAARAMIIATTPDITSNAISTAARARMPRDLRRHEAAGERAQRPRQRQHRLGRPRHRGDELRERGLVGRVHRVQPGRRRVDHVTHRFDAHDDREHRHHAGQHAQDRAQHAHSPLIVDAAGSRAARCAATAGARIIRSICPRRSFRWPPLSRLLAFAGSLRQGSYNRRRTPVSA